MRGRCSVNSFLTDFLHSNEEVSPCSPSRQRPQDYFRRRRPRGSRVEVQLREHPLGAYGAAAVRHALACDLQLEMRDQRLRDAHVGASVVSSASAPSVLKCTVATGASSASTSFGSGKTAAFIGEVNHRKAHHNFKMRDFDVGRVTHFRGRPSADLGGDVAGPAGERNEVDTVPSTRKTG